MPIATWLMPTACRQRTLSGTSWWILPDFSITKCAQVPGFSPRLAAFEANVFHVAEYELLAVKCSTITRAWSFDDAVP